MRFRHVLSVIVTVAALAGCSESNDRPTGGDDTLQEVGFSPDWANQDDAWIRPGVPIGGASFASFLPERGTCTANFIFANASRQAVYIGTAAHCFADKPLGHPASVGYPGQEVLTKLAYSSWHAMNLTMARFDETCDQEDAVFLDERACFNDFALLEIAKADWKHVNPSTIVYGGPTGLGSTPMIGALVSTYGNSQYRPMPGETTDARSGPVLDANDQRILIHTGIPSTPGDSGGPVLDADLQAVGVVIHLYHLPPTTNGAANLAWLLDETGRAGHGVELVSG